MSSHYIAGRTIAAIATAPGTGSIAIVRLSGSQSIEIAAPFIKRPLIKCQSHRAYYTQILENNKDVIDHALVLIMKAPHSFTGEDTVEIHCHGGHIIAKKILLLLLENGALSALPGEFSYKAFINNKIDLTQAEAIQQTISAQHTYSVQMAQQQLSGQLEKKIRNFQSRLLDTAAILEAWVDYPEEGLEFASQESLIENISSILLDMQTLCNTFADGQALSSALCLALIGRPNVGKSSLLNQLLKKERAIVTSIAGTTRDMIAEEMLIGDLSVRLIDTAGLHQSNDTIEQEGMRRSKQAADSADLILLVLDAKAGLHPFDSHLLNTLPSRKTCAIWNKTDLPHALLPTLSCFATLFVSAKENQGLDQLQKQIRAFFDQRFPQKGEIVLTQQRHYQSLQKAIAYLTKVKTGLIENQSCEWISADMRSALQHLGHIIGMDVSEEILSSIFSKFCVGK